MERPTIREPMQWVRKSCHRRVIIGSNEVLLQTVGGTPLPDSVRVLTAGQPGVSFVKEALGDRVLSAEKYSMHERALLEATLSKAQVTLVADDSLYATNVRHFFQADKSFSEWSAQIDDPAVLALAQKTSTRVKNVYEGGNGYRTRRCHQPSPWSKRDQALASAFTLDHRLNVLTKDPAWVLAHASLAPYVPALLATGDGKISEGENLRCTLAEYNVTQLIFALNALVAQGVK